MPELTPLANAFTDTFMDLYAVDLPRLRYYTNQIDFAIGRLCEALEQSDQEDVKELAHRAYRAVLGLAQLLDPADSDDRRTRDKLDLSRGAIDALLDELDTLVSGFGRD